MTMLAKIVVMGVSGTGKSTFGAAIARRLAARFVEGDDLHPAANRAKMAAGQPLTDADRAPWLHKVAATLDEADGNVVATCSALKRDYRQMLRDGCNSSLRFISLEASAELIADRMARRPGHYMPVTLLPSQLATYERPGAKEEDALVLDASRPLDALIAEAMGWLETAATTGKRAGDA